MALPAQDLPKLENRLLVFLALAAKRCLGHRAGGVAETGACGTGSKRLADGRRDRQPKC